MKQEWLQTCWTLIMITFILAACHPSPRDLTLVSGKTIYGDLALEDVHIESYRWDQSQWRHFSDTRSGYHGSFRIHLPDGKYRLQASTTIRLGNDEFSLSGTLEDLKVERDGGRIDQVVIRMNQQ